jgi:hypothetical protein
VSEALRGPDPEGATVVATITAVTTMARVVVVTIPRGAVDVVGEATFASRYWRYSPSDRCTATR